MHRQKGRHMLAEGRESTLRRRASIPSHHRQKALQTRIHPFREPSSHCRPLRSVSLSLFLSLSAVSERVDDPHQKAAWLGISPLPLCTSIHSSIHPCLPFPCMSLSLSCMGQLRGRTGPWHWRRRSLPHRRLTAALGVSSSSGLIIARMLSPMALRTMGGMGTSSGRGVRL